MDKKCLIVASVSSMISLFNMPNIELLQSMGYDITVAANFSFGNVFSNNHAEELWNKLESMNVKVYNIKFFRNAFNLKNVTFYRQIKRLIKENDYSLIHCHSPIGGAITRLAVHKARKKNSKIIYTAHGFHFYKGAPIINWLLYYPMEKWLSKCTDVLITMNKEDYELAKRKMKAKSTHYIPGIGVDTDKFSKPNVDRDFKRYELVIPSDAVVLISVGELNKNKNHQIIIKAMAKLKTPNLHYCIAGIGNMDSELKKLAGNLGLQNSFHLLGYRTDIVDLLHMVDIFVFPSLREGLPVSLMEAMAAGLPCVASKIRGNIDLIEHGKGGFLCGVNEVDEYKKAIENIMENPGMGEYNKNIVQKFDIGVVMEQMKKIYNEG
jgi:glycosyltransferase involved in cell wall biosynthesis